MRSCAQHPFIVRHDLSSIFGVPLNKVRVIVPYVGGGYGSKSYTKIEPLTAACSLHVNRPVKLQLSVNEAMLTTRCDSAQVHVRTATDKNGNLLARQAEIYMDTGAYAENSPLVCSKMANRIVGPYKIPNVKVSSYAIYTNSAPASSFRGFGATQVSFAAESQMDELADQIEQFKKSQQPKSKHLSNFYINKSFILSLDVMESSIQTPKLGKDKA